jgi:DNA polymerase-1
MMLAVFADPHGDIHRSTAAAIIGKSIDMVDDEDRRKAKPVNFGYDFGMGEKRFQLYARYDYGVYLTLAECKEFRDRFFETYVGILPWHQKMMNLCKEQGYVESFMGRRRRPDKIYSTNWEERGKALRQAINSPIQAGASDLTVFAALQLPQNPAEILPVAFGHDSFLYEVREDVVDYWQPLVKSTFEGVHKQLLEKLGVTLNIPLIADVVVGDSWAKGGP